MGHRVFHPVYYVLVMSEGQIIGLVCTVICYTVLYEAIPTDPCGDEVSGDYRTHRSDNLTFGHKKNVIH